MAAPMDKSVLFVCKGNTCRSPMAERIFSHMLEERGKAGDWRIDSAAVCGYMVGRETNAKTNHQLEKNGIRKTNHIAKLITQEDYMQFHYIFGFDLGNLSLLLDEERKPPSCTSVIRLLGDLDPEKQRIIHDPYFVSTEEAFQNVFIQIKRCLEVFLKEVNGECNGSL